MTRSTGSRRQWTRAGPASALATITQILRSTVAMTNLRVQSGRQNGSAR